MKKHLPIIITAAVLVACLAVGLILFFVLRDKDKEDEGARLLSFAQANSIEEMEALNGQMVSIIGYMSTLSPVNGEFMYLMNLPYQSCPFCVPNTTELSNTMAVYAKDGKEFEFTDQAIQVTGVMDFGDYTDEFGYDYSYRIKDASYSVLSTDNMSEELRVWQQLASSGVVSDAYSMFEYVNFLCYWPTRTERLPDGKTDYISPESAIAFIEKDGESYNYGFKEGYFDNIINTVKEVDAERFADLVKMVEDAKALSEKAYADLKNGKYRITDEYSNRFGDSRSQYELYNWYELETSMREIYKRFATWLAGWEI